MLTSRHWCGVTFVSYCSLYCPLLLICGLSEATSFITCSRIALPAACLSICIHLERLASFGHTSSPQAKQRRIIFECVMCFGLPVVYAALRTFTLSLSVASTQTHSIFGRPDRSTSSIRSILWFWLSTYYLSYHCCHLSRHDTPAFADSYDDRLRWCVLSCLKSETCTYSPSQGLLGDISLSTASSFMGRGVQSPLLHATCISGSSGWRYWKRYSLLSWSPL